MAKFTYYSFLKEHGLPDCPQARALHQAWEESLVVISELPPGEQYEVDLADKGCLWLYATIVIVLVLILTYIL